MISAKRPFADYVIASQAREQVKPGLTMFSYDPPPANADPSPLSRAGSLITTYSIDNTHVHLD